MGIRDLLTTTNRNASSMPVYKQENLERESRCSIVSHYQLAAAHAVKVA